MKLISLISLIFLSVSIEAPPVIPFLTTPNLQSLANYAAAAYCKVPLDNWNCGELCEATPRTEVVKIFNNEKKNTMGYIAVDRSKNLIVVSYRGTERGNFKNIMTDLDFIPREYPPAPHTKVHNGFYSAFEEIQPQVTDEVIKVYDRHPTFSIAFTGHSLGGALATLSALDLIQKVPALDNNDQLFLTTFGQPRVGNQLFAKYVDNHVKSARVIVNGDPIPRLPPRFTIPIAGDSIFYEHFGEELFLFEPETDSSKFLVCKAEDENCSERLSLTELSISAHSGPYFGVSMRDCEKQDPPPTLSVENEDPDDKEFENFDFTTHPFFVFDPNFDYGSNLRSPVPTPPNTGSR